MKSHEEAPLKKATVHTGQDMAMSDFDFGNKGRESRPEFTFDTVRTWGAARAATEHESL
jgi:hypothetical protein